MAKVASLMMATQSSTMSTFVGLISTPPSSLQEVLTGVDVRLGRSKDIAKKVELEQGDVQKKMAKYEAKLEKLRDLLDEVKCELLMAG